MKGAVLFDIDGTLIDTVDLHARAWHEALRHFGHDVGYERVRSQIGKGGDNLLPMFLTEDELSREAKALEAWRADLFKREYLPKAKPFAEVPPLFETLRADGWRIALASSSKQEELDHYKRLIGVERLIDAEVSKSDVERSKPNRDIFEAALGKLGSPDRDKVIVVGDSPYDAEAAGKLGLRTIGVRCGGFSEPDLRGAGCFVLYDDPADLLRRYDESPFGRRLEAEERRLAWQGKQNRVEVWRLRHASLQGGWSEVMSRETVERGHAVAVLPYDPALDRVVLIRQFRIGAAAADRFPWIEEIVAGMIDEGERPEEAAMRECREEIGCAPAELRPVLVFQPSASFLTQTVRLYCGRIDSGKAAATGGAKGEGEDIAVLVQSWARVAERLAAGGFASATTLVALQWLALHRERLLVEWG